MSVCVMITLVFQNIIGILEYNFGILEYYFGILEYNFDILKYNFGILEYDYGILEYHFAILKYHIELTMILMMIFQGVQHCIHNTKCFHLHLAQPRLQVVMVMMTITIPIMMGTMMKTRNMMFRLYTIDAGHDAGTYRVLDTETFILDLG